MRVVVIADDLTGALDTAVAFATRGLRTVCARTVDDLVSALRQGAEVVAVSTGSRELDEASAVARVETVRAVLAAHPQGRDAIWFKKIDSRLKGHIAAETGALRRPGQPVLLCPAIPRLGRHVVGGAVTGSGVEHPISISSAAPIEGCQVIDATTDMDIDTGLALAPGNALLVGAAGLAEALSRALAGVGKPVLPPALPAPALVAIGSRDPVTLAQLAGLRVIGAPNGVVPEGIGPAQTWQVLQLTPGAVTIAPREAARVFAAGVARWVVANTPATLVLSGGETAAAVMRDLGIGLIEIVGEAVPGMPVSRALDGRPGLVLVTKSGGFGAPGALVNLIGKLVKPA